MQTLITRLKLSQKIAVICGGLCLVVSLTLAGVATFSARYILTEQEASYGIAVSSEAADEIGDLLASGDLIGLEVALENLIALNQLRGIRVYDVDGRQIGSAGSSEGSTYRTDILMGESTAGTIEIYLRDNVAMQEQRSMALGLLMLALVLSVFAAGLASRFAQADARRIEALIKKLDLEDKVDLDEGIELDQLESVVNDMPLELLQSRSGEKGDLDDYQTAGLLLVRFNSLVSYVETLDETTLLNYTRFQNKLISAAADLYEGEVIVVRQFTALISFSGEHKSGSPLFRAACTAWLIKLLAKSLQKNARLKLSLSLCCASTEGGSVTSGDFYSALYAQHIIDEMEEALADQPENIMLLDEAAQSEHIANRTLIEKTEQGMAWLSGFPDPTNNLVERQHQLLIKQLRADA